MAEISSKWLRKKSIADFEEIKLEINDNLRALQILFRHCFTLPDEPNDWNRDLFTIGIDIEKRSFPLVNKEELLKMSLPEHEKLTWTIDIDILLDFRE